MQKSQALITDIKDAMKEPLYQQTWRSWFRFFVWSRKERDDNVNYANSD